MSMPGAGSAGASVQSAPHEDHLTAIPWDLMRMPVRLSAIGRALCRGESPAQVSRHLERTGRTPRHRMGPYCLRPSPARRCVVVTGVGNVAHRHLRRLLSDSAGPPHRATRVVRSVARPRDRARSRSIRVHLPGGVDSGRRRASFFSARRASCAHAFHVVPGEDAHTSDRPLCRQSTGTRPLSDGAGTHADVPRDLADEHPLHSQMMHVAPFASQRVFG